MKKSRLTLVVDNTVPTRLSSPEPLALLVDDTEKDIVTLSIKSASKRVSVLLTMSPTQADQLGSYLAAHARAARERP